MYIICFVDNLERLKYVRHHSHITYTYMQEVMIISI
jgi:hypothetical protein